eukprot:XP_011679830.1 PREDICTED: GDT1-like protein 3 [Strongylocentrotus purpuratus]
MGRRVRTVRRCAAYLHLLSCLMFGLCSLGLAYAHDESQSKEQRPVQGDQAAAMVAGELKDNDIIVNEDKGEGGLDSPGEKGRMDMTFVHAFVASLSVIIVSELGDKTFFIAAIMAMRHPRITIFAGALSALAVMTVLSAMLGYAITIIPRKYTYYASTVLFFIFGIRMLREGWSMSPDEGQEELEEVQADLKRRDEEKSKSQQNHIENLVEVNGDEVSKFKVQRSSHQHEHITAIIAGNWLFTLSHQHNIHLFILRTLPKIQSRKCYNVLYLPFCVCYIGYISTCMWMCSVGPNNCFVYLWVIPWGGGNFCDIPEVTNYVSLFL